MCGDAFFCGILPGYWLWLVSISLNDPFSEQLTNGTGDAILSVVLLLLVRIISLLSNIISLRFSLRRANNINVLYDALDVILLASI